MHLFLRSRVFRSSSSVEIVKCPREILVQLQCCGYGSIPASCTPYIESETTFVVACISMMSNSIWQHVSRKAATRTVVRSGRSHANDRACINCGRLQFLSLAQLCLRRERSKFQASFLLFFCLRQRPSHSGTRSANVPAPRFSRHITSRRFVYYYIIVLNSWLTSVKTNHSHLLTMAGLSVGHLCGARLSISCTRVREVRVEPRWRSHFGWGPPMAPDQPPQ